jgi:hypothetical protein
MARSSKYEHLNLKAWPFHVVPEEQSASVWAGRPKTKVRLRKLLQRMDYVPRSGLHLLWANFGMGKTHTLYYIRHLCKQNSLNLLPVYTVLPKRAAGFVELYRALVDGMLGTPLSDKLRELGRRWPRHISQHPIFVRAPDLVSVLLALDNDDPGIAASARQWISARGRLYKDDLRRMGVSRQLRSVEDCLEILSTLTQLLASSPTGEAKVLVMVDELQRIGQLTPKLTQEINAGLHSYYNQNPTGLELILSFSFGRQEDIRFLLSDELLSRAEPLTLKLDVLSEAEAIHFISDLLEQYRVVETENTFEPFTAEAVTEIVAYIAARKQLTPRRLMHYFNHVLLEREFDDLHDGQGLVTQQDALRYLQDSAIGELDADQAD